MNRPLLTALFCSFTLPAFAQDALDMGRERAEAFLAGDIETIWADMTTSKSIPASVNGLPSTRPSSCSSHLIPMA